MHIPCKILGNLFLVLENGFVIIGDRMIAVAGA